MKKMRIVKTKTKIRKGVNPYLSLAKALILLSIKAFANFYVGPILFITVNSFTATKSADLSVVAPCLS
jgi:hypothetical protein